jgi:hypothetical protein
MSYLQALAPGVAAIMFAACGLAQSPGTPARNINLDFNALPRPPIPADPLEMVTGNAEAVQNTEQRAAATALVINAHALSNVRAQPYHLKTSFVSSGKLPSDGNWILEDISPSRTIYRWTAQGPNYAGVNLYTGVAPALLYTNQLGGVLPLRLAQVRAAIFFNVPVVGPQLSMRTASGYLNGVKLDCVLTTFGFRTQALTGGRGWEESEYCVDPSTGLMTIYSLVPGLYVHYDYTNAIKFHNKIIPSSFTISEAGQVVIEAKTESLSDPPDPKGSLFDSAGLSAAGVGSIMTSPARSRSFVPLGGPLRIASNPTSAAIQVVVVHGAAAAERASNRGGDPQQHGRQPESTGTGSCKRKIGIPLSTATWRNSAIS